jgi:curved DNA-binding protein CbpA
MHKYYKILGLPENASKQEIKKAYRQLAFQYHPDKNKSPEAERRFLEISEAYEMLTSPIAKKRLRRSKAAHQKEKEEEIKKAQQKARDNMRKRYNEFKKQEEKAQTKQYIIGIYLFVAIVLLIVVSYTSYNYWYDQQAYTNSDTTMGRITFVDYRSYMIAFHANGKKFNLEKNGDRAFEDLNGKNGMPLEIGEEFLVVFNQDNPKYFDVLFDPITRQTFKIYEQKTLIKIKLWMTENEMKVDDYRARCFFVKIYETFGIPGLAAMYYFNEPLVENTDNNAWTFETFSNQQEFKDIVEYCQ